jgi:hypothetical protein
MVRCVDNETKVVVARWCIRFYLVDDLDLDWAVIGCGGSGSVVSVRHPGKICVSYSLFTYPTGVSGRHGVSIFRAVDVVEGDGRQRKPTVGNKYEILHENSNLHTSSFSM